MRRVLIVFLFFLMCVTLLIGLLITRNNVEVRQLGIELGKIAFQVSMVAIIGGILVQEYNRRRERKEVVNEFRKTIMRNLVHSYAGAKKARRLLRARCRSCAEVEASESRLEMSREAYEEQMGSLSETQLELEILVHELNTFAGAFSRRNEIRKAVMKMEKYLGTLITEYETSLRDVEDTGFIKLNRLERLSDFLFGRKDSFFRKNFTANFQAALSMIQAERLGFN